jgi:hypothetical protein
MSKRWLRWMSMFVVLGAASLATHAQRSGPRSDPPRDRGCYCSGGEIECLWGRAAGCEVWCEYGGCECESASCFLGFPSRARCRCLGPSV